MACTYLGPQGQFGLHAATAKPVLRGNPCLEDLVISAATGTRAQLERRAGKTARQASDFTSGPPLGLLFWISLVGPQLELCSQASSTVMLGAAGEDHCLRKATFGNSCLLPLWTSGNGGVAGCRRKDPHVGMGNPSEMVLLRPFLMKRWGKQYLSALQSCYAEWVLPKHCSGATDEGEEPCFPAG